MAVTRLAAGFCGFMLALAVGGARADEGVEFKAGNCSGSPDAAVTKLPFPLNKWGQVSCTKYGHVLTSHDGWIWFLPSAGAVLVPSQVTMGDPKEVGNEDYFTKIEIAQVKGDEFKNAYGKLMTNLEKDEVKPDGYRVDITTSSGDTLKIYFFDYDTYAWGMDCTSSCDPEARFIVLDKNHKPEPRHASI
jgi:hypothetical protein